MLSQPAVLTAVAMNFSCVGSWVSSPWLDHNDSGSLWLLCTHVLSCQRATGRAPCPPELGSGRGREGLWVGPTWKG